MMQVYDKVEYQFRSQHKMTGMVYWVKVREI